MLVVSIVALLIVVWVLIRQTGFSLLNALLGRICGRTIRIKSVGWKRLEGIEISLPNGWNLHVNTLRFTFFPTNFSKPLLISLHDVRVEGASSEATNEEEQTGEDAPEAPEDTPSPPRSSTASKLHRLQSLAQYMAISIDGAHLIYLDSRAAAMLHCTMDDVRVEAFRGPKEWQAECSIRLLQGKALHRSSSSSSSSSTPSPPLAEFSLTLSLSLDSSFDVVRVSLHEPVLSISHRAVELCSTLKLPQKGTKEKEKEEETRRGERRLLNNLDLTLNTFAFRYGAVIDGTSRSLSLTSGATRLTRQGRLLQLHVVDAAVVETGRRTAVRSAAIAVDVKLPEAELDGGTPETRRAEARLTTAGAAVVCSVPDVLQWQTHAAAMLQLQKRSSQDQNENEEAKRQSPLPAPPSSPPSLLVDITHLDCTLIGLDGREWMAVAKLISLTKEGHSAEIAFDEVWVTRAGRPPTRGVHEWGEVISIGTAIVELSSSPSGGRSLVVAADDAKLEWSEDILQQLQQLMTRMGVKKGGGEKKKEGEGQRASLSLSVEATLRRATVVVTAREASMACIALLETTIRGGGDEWNVVAKETRLVSGARSAVGLRLDEVLTSTKMRMSDDWREMRRQYKTWKEKEAESLWRQIRQTHFEKRKLALNAAIPSVNISFKKGNEASVEIDSSAYLAWSPLLHSIALHVVRTTKGLTSSLSSPSSSSSIPRSPSPSAPLRLAVTADGDVQIDLELADYHVMSWHAPVVQGEVTARREVTVLAPSLQVEFDGVRWMTVTDVCIARRLHDPHMDSLRATTNGLATTSNKVWSWTAERLHFFVPFGFNWAMAFDEFTTAIKWVKMMSGKRAGRPADPRLAADLHVLIQEAILEMEDDPFERKLQSNHELKEDEVFECERRRQMLEDHIAAHIKSVPLFSQAKMDELYANLLAKNADIYISRHAQQADNDTPLVKSTWTKLELRALADESMRRDEQCLQLITELDPAAPPPSASIDWTTMWGRSVYISMEEWHVRLRDYPLPYALAQNLHMFGTVVAAERLSAGGRSLREQKVPLPPPWTTLTVNRNISPLKLFYDLQAESDSMTLNYGPCWEPALAMMSLQWNNISKPSRDPSPLLPFWDKMRFLMHGHLLWSSGKFVTNMLSSLDPYNTSETLEWVWTDWGLDWAQGEIRTSSALEVFLHTASRYDETRILYLPSVNLRVEMAWNCLGQPYDHHAVELCTADKLPHLSTDHDSYRAFRSLSVKTVLSLVVHADDENGGREGEGGEEGGGRPKVLLYANCVRCLDLLLGTLSRTNGNTRRGPVFGVPPISKRQLSKHFRNVHISIKLPLFEITYLLSQSDTKGIRLTCDQVELVASLVQSAQPPIDDKLRRRPLFRWSVEHISAALGETQVHLLGVDPFPPSPGSSHPSPSSSPLLSFSRVAHTSEKGAGAGAAQKKVTVHELRLSWTAAQRDVCLVIAEGTRRATLLRSMLGQHLSAILQAASEERKHYEQRRRKDGRDSARERDRWEEDGDETTSEQPADLLEKLIEEADTKKVAHCEHSAELPSDSLQGISQATSDDVTAISWHIELVNSQMMLGGEGGKFVLVAASRATLSQKVHRSVWRSAQLLGKKSWSAMLNGMQYFAPISRSASEDEKRSWLTKEEIEDRWAGEAHNGDRVNALMGAGEAVGGMVKTANGRQLQRIISRCSCQIYWVSFSEKLDDEEEKVIEESTEENEEMEEELAVDCITLKHNMLEAFTNSSQYSLAVDIVNKLVLFVDPRLKQNAENRNRRLFECRQKSMEDMISSIDTQQRKLREVVCLVRSIERQLFHMENSQAVDSERKAQLLREMEEYKTKQLDLAELMAITISVLKQRQVQQNRVVSSRMEEEVPVVRKFEVCFEDCTWKLTEHDGMIGIAQLHITNFLYARTMRVDNGGEHLFELGTMRVSNLLRDTPFPDTLDRDTRHPSSSSAVRILCKDLAPVGGIAVKEHFEVNIAPMVAQITKKFYDTISNFFFPGRNEGHQRMSEANLDTEEGQEKEKVAVRRLSLSRRLTGGLSMVRSSGRGTAPLVPIAVDDIDKMRQRANSNNLFLYIKIPEVPILVSYKGSKEKNIEDVRNLPLNFPLCEYHEKNWTWLDLSIAIKQRSRKVLLQQFMKQKILRRAKGDDKTPISDEEKKRIAIGITPTLVDKQKK